MTRSSDPSPAALQTQPLRIRETFADKTVLLTGATGLVGKVLLVKMLRDLPETTRVLLLIRDLVSPDGSRRSAADRMRLEIMDNEALTGCRDAWGNSFAEQWAARVECIVCDLSQPSLGLESSERALLSSRVDLVIGCAAAGDLDAPLDEALAVNVFAPRDLLEVARDAAAPFLQLTSAYTATPLSGLISETLSPANDDPEEPEAEIRHLEGS